MRNVFVRLKTVCAGRKISSKKLARCTRRKIRESGGGAIIGWIDIPILAAAGVRLDAVSQK
jgi:hypothetical protein